MDLSESIIPNSDQLNAEDLLQGPRMVTVTDVVRGSAEQPVNIVTAEFGPSRPYRPSKTMRRVLVAAWGSDASAYVGRRMMIYREPEITFGKDKVGGIRISALSHIERRLTLTLMVTRGKRAPFTVEPLADGPTEAPKPPNSTRIIEAFAALNVTAEQLEAKIGRPRTAWTADDIAGLSALGKAIKNGDTTPHEEFEGEGQ